MYSHNGEQQKAPPPSGESDGGEANLFLGALLHVSYTRYMFPTGG